MKLGYGELTPSAAIPARREFFRAIERVAPEVVSSLAQEVFPLYSAACEAGRTVVTREQMVGKSPELKALREALDKWAENWGLRAAWCLDYAIFFLHFWRVLPRTVGQVRALPGGGPFKFPLKEIHPDLDRDELGQRDEIPEPPAFDEWEPWLETREAYLERAKAALERYCDQVQAAYEQAGWQEGVEKRARSGTPLVHFEWLVRYQVQRRTCERIAEECQDEEGLDPASVYQAISETAKLIGLPLAPLPKGRKRKA